MCYRLFRDGLGLVALTLLSASSLSSATLRVVAVSNIGDELQPEIHLYQSGSHKDFWPSGHKLTADAIPPGWYTIEVSLAGFRRFERQLEIYGEDIALRVIMIPALEAAGELSLGGKVTHLSSYDRLWVLAFPLEGPPADMTESMVTAEGRFRVSTTHAGVYLLVIVRGVDVLATQRVYIGIKNTDVEIEAREPLR